MSDEQNATVGPQAEPIPEQSFEEAGNLREISTLDYSNQVAVVEEPPEQQPEKSDWTPLKIKVGGEEREVADREEAIRLMQQGQDYTRKTQELARERGNFDQFKGFLAQNPDLADAIRRRALGEPIQIKQAVEEPLIDKPEEYEPWVNKLVDKVGAVEKELAQIKYVEQARNQQNYQGLVDSACDNVRKYHEKLTGQPMNETDTAYLGNYISANNFDWTNPEHLKAAYNQAFPDRFEKSVEQRTLDNIAKNRKQGILPSSSGSRPEAKGDMPRFTGPDAFDNTTEWLQKKHGIG